MWWLAIVGPLLAVLVYVLTDRPDRRRAAEIERWRKLWGPAARQQVKREDSAYRSSREVAVDPPPGGPRVVTSLPGPLARILAATGGGQRVAFVELVPKLAYLAFMRADLTQGSDHATVVAKLDEQGPTFTVRPLPIVEGERVPNTGVQFKKDPEFTERFLVELTLDDGLPAPIDEAVAKQVRKWLSPPLREALLDFPDVWLRVDGKGKAMGLTLYGPTDAARIDELVEVTDVIFAEYGAGGGPSLLPGDEEDEAPKPQVAAAKAKPAAKKGSSAAARG